MSAVARSQKSLSVRHIAERIRLCREGKCFVAVRLFGFVVCSRREYDEGAFAILMAELQNISEGLRDARTGKLDDAEIEGAPISLSEIQGIVRDDSQRGREIINAVDVERLSWKQKFLFFRSSDMFEVEEALAAS